MKRMRDDAYPGSQFKRPYASSSFGQSQVPEGGGRVGGSPSQKLTTNDALTYLKEVKDMFQDQRDKYDMFLEVMKDFKAQRTDTGGVIARVKELFKGHNNLILGFNTFLPKGYEITVDEVEPPTKKTVEFDEAISFVNKIKKRFQNSEHIYKSFLDILNMYRKEQKDINEVYSEVSSLFEDHPDLLEEFTRFLPDDSPTNGTHDVPSDRSLFQRPGERHCAKIASRPLHVEKHRNRPYRPSGFHADRNPSVDRQDIDDDDDKTLLKVQKDQRRHHEKESNRNKRNVEVDDRESEHDIRDFSSHHVLDKRKHTRKVDGFISNSDYPFSDDKDALKGMYNEGFMFCEKVKERLCSADDYQAFLKLLNIYSNGIIKRNDLQNLVTDLLGKHPNLMNEFNEFLERCENIDGFLAGIMSKKSLSHDSNMTKIEHKHEAEGKKEPIRSDYLWKSIQELDLSECQRCTPSYRLLPDDYPIPSASQRSEQAAQVLNDHWVSVTSGSEDYSFKHMRRNQYEESLFRCEDDRFELDMLIESVSSTTKRVEELLSTASENKNILETPLRVENHFSALNLRCIERIYGDHGLDVMDILRRNPNVALPVILARLKQKQDEWTKCRTDFNKVWADVYAKNHYKSLDHRSFYFKQQDSKNLSTKSLVTEIKELKEKHQKEDDLLQAIASGNRPHPVSHFNFSYSDEGVHEDIYKIFQYSCEEVCSTKEQLNKVMRLWISFLEPMLGIPSRTQCKGLSEVGKTLRGVANSSASVGRVENGASPDANISASLKLKSEKDKGENQPLTLMNGDISLKDKVYPESERACMLVSCSDVNHPEKEPKGYGVNMTNYSVLPGECKESKVKANNEVNLLSSLSWDTFHKKKNDAEGHNDNSAEPPKSDKEEGELSPTGEFEEHFLEYKEDGVKSMPEPEPEQENQSTNREGGEGGNGADADDEDSEHNVSERGGEVSGTDECSHDEENEEEDDEEGDQDEADAKAESEGEHDAHCGADDAVMLPLSQRFLASAKPLSKRVQADQLDERRDSSRVFYANDDFYVLFRLHQALYERVFSAKTNSISPEKQKSLEESACLDPYDRFMTALYNLLDGTIDNAKFEDECRDIIGNQSYILFTMDKLIYKLVKQLQLIVTDDMDNKLLQLYDYEKDRGHGKFIDSVYYENVRVLLHDENIYRMKFTVDSPGLTIQLMDNVSEKPEAFAVSIEPNFAAYLFNDFLLAIPSRKEPKDVYLQRNKRAYSRADENSVTSSALDGVELSNGLECKIACISSKISYVLDTEDFLFRPRSKRRVIPEKKPSSRNLKRVERFHRFLSAAVVAM